MRLEYSEKNIRGNIGLEAIYNNGMTLSLNYERFQHIDNHRYSHTDSFRKFCSAKDLPLKELSL